MMSFPRKSEIHKYSFCESRHVLGETAAGRLAEVCFSPGVYSVLKPGGLPGSQGVRGIVAAATETAPIDSFVLGHGDAE